MAKVGNSSWLADLVKFIKGKVDGVREDAAAAQRTADGAMAKASNHTHNYSLGMVREFETGAALFNNPAKTYTTTGNLAKFYIISVAIDDLPRTVVLDYMAIQLNAQLGAALSVYIDKNSDGESIFLLASLNGNTVTFKLSSNGLHDRLDHIAGYY